MNWISNENLAGDFMTASMEIERKWIVSGWPDDATDDSKTKKNKYTLAEELEMEQGYLSTSPTLRIRSGKVLYSSEGKALGQETYILCRKSRSLDGGLSRREQEEPLSREQFEAFKGRIPFPLIHKVRRTYLLSDGSRLEVNHVDEGTPTEFWYAEIEYDSREAAVKWNPSSVDLEHYLDKEVTHQKGQSMAAYWNVTRRAEN